MPVSATFRCATCDTVCASFALYEANEPGPVEPFMFAEPLEDTSVARLSYELPDSVGVRIVPKDKVDEVRAALASGIDTASAAIPDLVPSTCPRGHPLLQDH